MKALAASQVLVLVSAALSLPLPLAAQADITGFNDPALVQARQAYQSALRGQTNTQASVSNAQSAEQAAALAAADARNRANFASGSLQNLINQIGGDVDAIRQQRDAVNQQIQNANAQIPDLQFNRIPSLNQRINALNGDLANTDAFVRDRQVRLNQARAQAERARIGVQQAQAALQPALQVEAQDRSIVQNAQGAVVEAQGAMNSAQAELNGANNLRARATNWVNSLNSEIHNDQNQIGLNQSQIQRNNSNIQVWSQVRPNDPNYRNAQMQIRAAEIQNGNLGRQIQQDRQRLNAAQSNLPRAMAQLNQAQNMIAQATGRLSAANQNKAIAEQRVAAAQSRLQQQEQAMAPLRAQLEQRNQVAAAAQSAADAAQADLNLANGHLADVQNRLANVSRDLALARDALNHDLEIQAEGPGRLADLNDKLNRLQGAHEQVFQAQTDLQQAQAGLQSAQVNLNNAKVQNQNASTLLQSAQAQLDSVCSSEAIVYLQGAGGIGLAEPYNQTLQEISPALSGPNAGASGLTVYTPGVSILWGSQNGSYVGSEAIVLRSSTSPASQASSLQGYTGALSVPAIGDPNNGGASAMTLAIGSTVNMPTSDSVAGHALINQLFNALEPQGSLTTGNSVDCTLTNLCQIQTNDNGNLVLVLPNSILVLAPAAASDDGSANYTVQTIALLNSQTLAITQDLQNVISVVSAQ